MLTDITQQSEHLTAVPEKVAVHCHIFYHDLINEFRQHLTVVPFAFDVLFPSQQTKLLRYVSVNCEK